jgi:hypothetical protein
MESTPPQSVTSLPDSEERRKIRATQLKILYELIIAPQTPLPNDKGLIIPQSTQQQ